VKIQFDQRNVVRVIAYNWSCGKPIFIPGFNGFRVARSLVFCVMFCRSLFIPFLLASVLSVGILVPLWYLQTLQVRVTIAKYFNLVVYGYQAS